MHFRERPGHLAEGQPDVQEDRVHHETAGRGPDVFRDRQQKEGRQEPGGHGCLERDQSVEIHVITIGGLMLMTLFEFGVRGNIIINFSFLLIANSQYLKKKRGPTLLFVFFEFINR